MVMQSQDQTFESFLKRKELSEKTIKEYLLYLNQFGYQPLTNETINWFIDKYPHNPVARGFLLNLKDYYREELDQEVHQLIIPKRKGRKEVKLPKVLMKEEISDIEKVMKSERNKLMLLLSFYSGLRITELINIHVMDFNWNVWCKDTSQLGKLRIKGKGGKERIALVPPFLMLRFYHYITGRFLRERLWDIKGNAWAIILSKASKKALGKHVNPHLLRHSCATFLMDCGFDLQYIRDFLGHKSISSTQIYTHISRKHLEQKYSEIDFD